MPTEQQPFERLALLKQAGIRTGYFARYCGIHRVTVSMWVNGRSGRPRPLYLQKANEALDVIEAGLTKGVFPLPETKKRDQYDAFVEAMRASSAA